MSLWYEFIAFPSRLLKFQISTLFPSTLKPFWLHPCPGHAIPLSLFKSPEWVLILSGVQAYNKVICESMLLTSSPAISRHFQVWVL